MKKKYQITIGVIIALFFTFSVYMSSCTKVGNNPACELLHCLNGGYCDTMYLVNDTGRHKLDTAKCYCPVGYTGLTCDSAVVSKYFGNWQVTDTVHGTDSILYRGRDSIYVVLLDTTATPTTFFLNSFLGNPNYNKIACTLDSGNGFTFVFDTSRGFRMSYDHMILISGSGTISPNYQNITASFIIHYLSPTSNWEIDTVNMHFTRLPK